MCEDLRNGSMLRSAWFASKEKWSDWKNFGPIEPSLPRCNTSRHGMARAFTPDTARPRWDARLGRSTWPLDVAGATEIGRSSPLGLAEPLELDSSPLRHRVGARNGCWSQCDPTVALEWTARNPLEARSVSLERSSSGLPGFAGTIAFATLKSCAKSGFP